MNPNYVFILASSFVLIESEDMAGRFLRNSAYSSKNW